MSRRLIPLAIALGALASCSAATTTQQPTSWHGIDVRLDHRLRVDGLPGAVLIVRRRNADVYRHDYGTYNATTPLPMASVSKWLTAALVMTFVNSGRFSLDQRLGTYAPQLRGPVALVTMRQLLSNTHGLSSAPGCLLSLTLPANRCDEQVGSMKALTPPGTRFTYGPTGATLAGRVVELLSGRSFEEAFQVHLARPLGLLHTSFLATFQDERPTAPDPAAGVVSTAADCMRFEEMLSAGGTIGSRRLLSARSVDAMYTTATLHTGFKSDAVAAGLSSVGYALGAWVEAVGAHGQAALIDGSGAYGTYPWIDRRHDVYGILAVFDPNDPGPTGAVRRSHDDVSAVETVMSG